jgi:type IV secretory pathway VirB4 component
MSDDENVTFPPRINALEATLGPLTLPQIVYLAGFGGPGALLGWIIIGVFPHSIYAALTAAAIAIVFIGLGTIFAFRKKHGIPLLNYLLLKHQFKKNPQNLSGEACRRFVPIRDLTDRLMVLPNDNYVGVVEVAGVNLSLLSSSEQDEHVKAFYSWLNSIDFAVQVISRPDTFDNYPYIEHMVDRAHEEQNPLLKQHITTYADFFDNLTAPTLERRFYVVVPLGLRSAAPHLYNGETSPQDSVKLSTAGELMDRRIGIVVDSLQGVGLSASRVEGERLVILLKHYYHFNEGEKKPPEGNVTIMDAIAPSRVALYPDCVVVGDEYIRVYKVEGYPTSLPVGWLSFVYSAQARIDCVLHVQPLSQETALATIRHEVSRLQVAMLSKRQKGTVDTSAFEHQAEIWEGLRSSLLKQEEKLFFIGQYIAVRSKSYADVVSLSERLESSLRGCMVRAIAPRFRQVQALRSTMPLGRDYLDSFSISSSFLSSLLSPVSSYLLPTSSVATMYPFSSSVMSQNGGILYGFSETNGTPVIFNRYSMENYNTAIFGVSGSGKSYMAKLEILRQMAQDGSLRVFIVDPLREFDKVTEALGGSVLKIGPKEDSHVNPLWIGKDAAERARFSLQFLNMLLELSREERALLDGILAKMYIDRQDEFTLDELHKELAKETSVIAQRITALLRPYTKGGSFGFLSHTTDVNMDARVVCLDIQDLDRDLFTPTMTLLLDFLLATCRADMRRKLVVVDEAWHLMDKEDSARALANFTRHSRHYHTGITLISQTAADFLEHEEGRIALTNSSIVLLARHKAVTETMKETFSLTSNEVNFIRFAKTGKDAGYSQALLISGVTHTPIRVVSSDVEHEIITTDPAELLARDEEAQTEGVGGN